jgi:hypothetical protein
VNWQTGNGEYWQLPIRLMAKSYAKMAESIGRGLEKLWQQRGVYRYPRLPLALPIEDVRGETEGEKYINRIRAERATEPPRKRIVRPGHE